MCGEHRRLVSEPAIKRIRHARDTLKRTDLTEEQQRQVRESQRMALAIAFAEVCDQLGLDLKEIYKPQPKLTPIAAAVKREIQP